MTTTPVPMDPRIRDRRIEVQREAGRKRLRFLLIATTVFVVAGLSYLTVESPLLDVDKVRVRGAEHIAPAAVQAAARVHLGQPLLRVNTAAVERRVESIPWVQHAHVARHLPGTLTITVTEFQTTTFVRTPDGAVVLIAPNGRVVARAARPTAGTVEIVGLRRAPLVGELLSPPDAASVLQRMPPELASAVRVIDVAGSNVTLRLTRGGEVRLGSFDALRAKGAAALAVMHNLGSTPFTYIDVTSPAAPVVG
jgi:cell division protein FtsQ